MASRTGLFPISSKTKTVASARKSVSEDKCPPFKCLLSTKKTVTSAVQIVASSKSTLRKDNGVGTSKHKLHKVTCVGSSRSTITRYGCSTGLSKGIVNRNAAVPVTNKKTIQAEAGSQENHVRFKSKATDQEILRAKLDAWLEAKGKAKSVNKYRHHNCYDSEHVKQVKPMALADRTLTQTILSQQNKVLNNEAVKKRLFTEKAMSVTKSNKENLVKADEKKRRNIKRNAEPAESCRLDKLKKQDILNKIHILLQEYTTITSTSPEDNVLLKFTGQEIGALKTLKLPRQALVKVKLVSAIPQVVFEVDSDAFGDKDEHLPTESEKSSLNELTSVNDYKGEIVGELTSVSDCKGEIVGELISVSDCKGEIVGELTSVNDYKGEMVGEMTSVNDYKGEMVGEMTSVNDYKGEIVGEMTSVNDYKGEIVGELISVNDWKEDKSHPPKDQACENTMIRRETFVTSEHTTPSANKVRSSAHKNLGSTIKYSVGSVKPLLRQSSRDKSSSGMVFITPVRRSVRLSEMLSSPGSGLRRDIASVSDLRSPERQHFLFKDNPAITNS